MIGSNKTRARHHCRGCGGLFLTTPKPQNHADDDDISLCIKTVRETLPGAPLFLSGFSQGGNVGLRHLGRVKGSPFLACYAVGNPYCLVGTSFWLKYGVCA